MNETGSICRPRLASVGVALPPCVVTQPEAETLLTERYGRELSPRCLAVMLKALRHPSIRSRHFALEQPAALFDEDPDARIARFTRWAVDLGASAARSALDAAPGGPPVGCLVVNTCTGYVCPGLSTYLLEALRLPRETKAYDLVGAGCGGALPNLQLGAALVSSDPAIAALCVSVEICSATFQMGNDLGLIISNALFADGAGAAVLHTGGAAGLRGLEVVDFATLHAPEHREAIRYVHRGGQLHNQLSPGLPGLLRQKVAEVVRRVLGRHGLAVAEVRHWAIHPGGDKVVNAVQEGLGLSDEQLRVTRGVLRDCGNMSSATVWFEMGRVLASGVEAGEWCAMVGAGAGLSVHACLLRG